MCPHISVRNNIDGGLGLKAEEVGKRKDATDRSRKSLVQTTKKLRGGMSDDVKKTVAPLMKKFQSEIDSLTKRAKAAEQAFLSVYTKLHDAPDPVAILEGAVTDQKRSAETKELEIENKRLQATIQEYAPRKKKHSSPPPLECVQGHSGLVLCTLSLCGQVEPNAYTRVRACVACVA